MAQANLPALPQISAALAARPPGPSRGVAPNSGSGDPAFARVLDQRLNPGNMPKPAPPPAQPGKADKATDAKAGSQDTGPAQTPPAPTKQTASDDPAPAATTPGQASRPIEPGDATPADNLTQDAASSDPLQASLAGLPAALAALLAAPPAAAGNTLPEQAGVVGEAAASRNPAAALARLLGEAADRQKAAAAPTTGTEPADASANTATSGNAADPFKAALEAAGTGERTAPLSALATGDGPAAHAAEGTELAADAGTPTATQAEPNPAAGLAWALPAARAHQDDALRLHLAQPPSHPAWAESVGNTVTWMVGQQESKAELILTPPQLGRVEVTLSVQGDQTTAQFVAATPAAREALEQALPRLREVLAQAGIHLADSGVSTSSQHSGGREGSRQGGRSHEGNVAPIGEPASTGHPWLRRGEGLVDTFA